MAYDNELQASLESENSDVINATGENTDGTENETEQLNCCNSCGEPYCPHGICGNYCRSDGEPCEDCTRHENLERDAEAEVAFQRDVAGPLLGFSEEDAGSVYIET
jgi:hypothetical protein